MSATATISTVENDAKVVIKQLKEQGCVCIESMYGVSREECQKSPRIRNLLQMNPQRYFIGPSLCAGKNFGIGLWRRPIV
ncbi:hypothetical protein KBC31_01940 [Candidatus Saccharibacteria bacterium]|jgi:hypothetical protein|nr:hypothetical protein [Candidatus Saccharibacteria bacterium]